MARQGMTRRRLAAALLLGGLAACSSAGDANRTAQAPNTAIARFVPGGEVTVVQVTVSDNRPLRGAELTAPDGTVIPAYAIDVTPVAASSGPYPQPAPAVGMGGVGGFGGGSGGFGGGVGLSFPIGGYSTGNRVVTSGAVNSTALIRLPDPASYRADWQQWQVRLRVGDPPNVSYVAFAAPAPPAGL